MIKPKRTANAQYFSEIILCDLPSQNLSPVVTDVLRLYEDEAKIKSRSKISYPLTAYPPDLDSGQGIENLLGVLLTSFRSLIYWTGRPCHQHRSLRMIVLSHPFSSRSPVDTERRERREKSSRSKRERSRSRERGHREHRERGGEAVAKY